MSLSSSHSTVLSIKQVHYCASRGSHSTYHACLPCQWFGSGTCGIKMSALRATVSLSISFFSR